MSFRIFTVMIGVLVSWTTIGSSQESASNETMRIGAPMPIYVTPYYDSKGIKISVGVHSKELAKADAKSLLEFTQKLKKEREKLRAEVMYVAAIRLYDLGHKDEAVYWFYTAQYRARVFGSILDGEKAGELGEEAFELQQAYNSFNQLAGKYINGYAFGDLPKLEKTLATVMDEGTSLPEFAALYAKVQFAPKEVWVEKNKKVAEGLARLIEHIKTNADSIKEQRKKSGIDGKY